MIGIAIFAAAAATQAPVRLAGRDEAQWRMFVRASVQSRRAPAPDVRGGSRLIQLQGVVRQLGGKRRWEAQRLTGPSGL